VKDKLLAFWNSIKSAASVTWTATISYLAKIAAPVLSLLVLIGGVLAVIEYKTLLLKLYSWLAKKDLQAAEQTDDGLKTQEDADKAKAAQAIADSQNVKPDDDWYLKK
jgi:hypothetical protein